MLQALQVIDMNMPPARFERAASGLGILRSIHLSYGGAGNSDIYNSIFFLPSQTGLFGLLVVANLIDY